MWTTAERRATHRATLSEGYSGAFGRSRPEIWGAVCIVLAIVVLADVLTADLWLGPAYLLVICSVAWALGWKEALGIALACLAFTIDANDFELHSFATGSKAADMALRVFMPLAAIGLVTVIRSLYQREWRLARTDLLTGAMNRQAFFEIVLHAQPSKAWTVIAYSDLDGFKQINDVCGHEEGDEVLRAYADAVRRNIRKADLFARLGGDEFVVYMEVKDQHSAKMTAARLHLAMNDGLVQPLVSARCSLGVLILPPGASRGADRLRLADRLMYEAKQQGAALVAATMAGPDDSAVLVRHIELTPPPERTDVPSITRSSRAAISGMPA